MAYICYFEFEEKVNVFLNEEILKEEIKKDRNGQLVFDFFDSDKHYASFSGGSYSWARYCISNEEVFYLYMTLPFGIFTVCLKNKTHDELIHLNKLIYLNEAIAREVSTSYDRTLVGSQHALVELNHKIFGTKKKLIPMKK